MNEDGLEPTPHAAIILAGGDGSRLLSLTRVITGADLPKQFCCLDGRRTLLEATQQRVQLGFSPADTVVVVNQQHRRYYAPLGDQLPPCVLLEQFDNRGTAPAILHALIKLRQRHGDEAVVTIFPSDHYVDDDRAFMHHVAIAERALVDHPDLVVILGIAPAYPEPAYGWIETAEQIGASLEEAIMRVRCFWEKPPVPLAERLWLSGAYWNSFVFSARIGALFDLIRVAAPALFKAFQPLVDAPESTSDRVAAEVYRKLPRIGFSEAILAKTYRRLAMRPVNDVVWSDLGDPQRVGQTAQTVGWELGMASADRAYGSRPDLITAAQPADAPGRARRKDSVQY